MPGCSAATRGPNPLVVTIAALGVSLSAALTGCGSGQPNPSGSSDGLVFVQVVGGSNDVARVRLADAAVQPLTHTPDRNERWPYWSDAANRLVYQSEPVGGGNSDLLFWSAESGSETTTIASPSRDERWPVWSPDGTRLARAYFTEEGRSGVVAESLEGGPPQLLAMSGPKQTFLRPSYAPNGERLVAQRRGSDGLDSSLWILSPNARATALTADPRFFDNKPWFTRSGDHVLFSRRRFDGTRRNIAIVGSDGGAVRIIASTPDSDDRSGRPSPTRDEMAFCSDRSGVTNVYLADLDGGALRPLTQWTDRGAFAPRWSPDGNRLVVTAQSTGDASERLDTSHIVVLDRDGSVLLDIPGAMPDWMPPWR